ncbi:hypothetical protein BD560DRAFT_416322 [Blakeslea trispora]|nr:hypothetical protein BD560DRAFT_416322 [Blakeslea trispora]
MIAIILIVALILIIAAITTIDNDGSDVNDGNDKKTKNRVMSMRLLGVLKLEISNCSSYNNNKTFTDKHNNK